MITLLCWVLVISIWIITMWWVFYDYNAIRRGEAGASIDRRTADQQTCWGGSPGTGGTWGAPGRGPAPSSSPCPSGCHRAPAGGGPHLLSITTTLHYRLLLAQTISRALHKPSSQAWEIEKHMTSKSAWTYSDCLPISSSSCFLVFAQRSWEFSASLSASAWKQWGIEMILSTTSVFRFTQIDRAKNCFVILQ